MIPSYLDLSYFLEVSATKNISRAAERLDISQPSLSVALKRLEKCLGAPLFIRKKSGVELTKSGASLVLESKIMMQNWETLKSRVLSQSTELTGRFSIGCHVSVGHYSLATFLPQLMHEHPNFEIQLEHDLSRKITERVIQYQIDFGIVVNPVSHPDLVIHELCKDKVTLWALPKKSHDTLIYEANLHQSQSILQKLARRGTPFKRFMTSSSLEIIAELAEAGAGAAILPSRVVSKSASSLKLCFDDAPFVMDRICFIYRADAQKTAAAKKFISAIKTAKI